VGERVEVKVRTPRMKHGVWRTLRKPLGSELKNVTGEEEKMEERYVTGFII